MADEIYSSSYWGNGVCDNDIGWGGVYKDVAGCTPAFSSTNSMNFDGIDEYIKAPIPVEAYQQSTIRSFSFWVKINTLATYTPLFGGFGVTNLFRYANNFGIINGRLQWSLEGLNVNSNITSCTTELVNGSGTATNVADGNWHHIVIYNPVDNYTNRANITNCKIYLDGAVLTNDTVNSGTQAIRGFTGGGLVLGAGNTGSWDGQIYLDGLIDEFAYWNNHELTSTQVLDIYNEGSPTDLSTVSPSVNSWYRMGENGTWNGSKWTFTDEGSSSNDAESINMVEADRKTDTPPN